MTEATMPVPNEADIAQLQANPDTADKFDAYFGKGASAKYLDNSSTIGNIASGVIDGVTSAVDETANFVRQYGAPALKAVLPGSNLMMELATAASGGPLDPANVPKPITTPKIVDPNSVQAQDLSYQLPKGAAQFLTGFVAAGKFRLAEMGLSKGLSILAKGAIADAVVFDPKSPRFSNMIKDYFPGLESDVIDFLAAKPEDSDAMGRFKNALEGAGLGKMTDVLIHAFRGLRGFGKAGTPEAAKAALEESVKAVEENAPKGVLDDTGQMDLFPDDAAKAADAKAAADAAPVPRETEFRVVDPEVITSKVSKILSDATMDVTVDNIVNMVSEDTRAFNFARVNGTIDMKHVLQVTGDAIAPAVDKALGGSVETHIKVRDEAMKAFANETGEDIAQMLVKLEAFSKDAKEQAKLLTFGRIASNALASEIGRIAKKVNLGMASDVEKANMMHMVRALEDVMGATQVIRTAAARATSAGRIRIGADLSKEAVDHIKTIADVGGDEYIRKLASRLAAAGGEPLATRQIVKRSIGRKVIDAVNENWLNAILSGPKTHIVNITSNALMATLDPVTNGVGRYLVGDKQGAREAFRQYATVRLAINDSMQMARMAFRLGNNVLDTSTKVDDRQLMRAISAEAFGMSIDPMTGKALTKGGTLIDMLGVGLNIPSRLLMSSDEFFKQLTYRSNMYSQLYTEAYEKGLTGNTFKKYVADEFERRALNADGSARTVFNENLGRDVYTDEAAKALDAARINTFTNELNPGTFGATIQSAVNKHPTLRLVMPFVRTPTNILKTAVAYSPGANMLLKEYRNAIFGRGVTPEVRARAVGQMALGTTFYAGTAALVLDGRVTGGGPRDPATRQMWMESGWRPYSIRVGDKWVDYSRIDPFATALGTIADAVEILGQAETSDKTATDILLTTTLALGKTLTDKTYLQGLSTLLDVVSNPDRPDKASAYLETLTSSMIPYSSLMGQSAYKADPVMRETRGLLDRIASRVPGWSSSLPPKVSWLTGENMQRPDWYLMPVNTMSVKQNPIADELNRLGIAYRPAKTIYGYELSAQEYSDLNKKMATVTDSGGRNLQASLARLMETSKYDIKRERSPDTPEGVTGFREAAVQRVIESYHTAAVKALAAENPAFAASLKTAKMGAAAAKSTNPDASATGIEMLQSIKR